ncbi:tautomerase family protein [Acinetobacter ihumii]|uniref:tautomerase family protein n=1 Tax=Acinetobacter ihumii TaxID=2483802 RepID=UPI0010326FB5|nr:tautomerase family protein [Acinetobacter ihumii]
MSQIKIYAQHCTIEKYRVSLSNAIHDALVSALQYPSDKRFQRFIDLSAENFIYPTDRSDNYLIIEISMFSGRKIETKKQLIRQIFNNIEHQCKISPQDVEITIFETPRENWGIRGQHADELQLNYKVSI